MENLPPNENITGNSCQRDQLPSGAWKALGSTRCLSSSYHSVYSSHILYHLNLCVYLATCNTINTDVCKTC